jgi:hypothetical protein
VQAKIAAAFARLTLAVNRAAAPSWGVYVFWPSALAGGASVSGVTGQVRAHSKGGQTVYRFIPDVYSAELDGFYAGYSGGVLSGLIVKRG